LSSINCDDWTAVLQVYQTTIPKGRQLDLANDRDLVEGKTTQIFVSTSSIYHDVIEEVLSDEFDPSLPLKVTFVGENAEDYGGPRKELLRLNGCSKTALRRRN
jgi:hypothetical protein